MSECQPWSLHGRLQRGTHAPARFAVAVALAGALAVVGAPAADADNGARATIRVNTVNEAEIDGLCSLREAVQAANTDKAVDGCKAGAATDIIYVPAGAYMITQGELVLEGSTELRSSGAVLSRAAGQQWPYSNEPIVRIARTARAVLRGLVISGSGGRCTTLANEGVLHVIDGLLTEAVYEPPSSCLYGPGFDNRGTATMVRTSITNSRSLQTPGAFTNSGTLRIVQGVISGNSASSFQQFGVVFVRDNRGTLSLEATTYQNNGIGSLHNSGRLTVRNSRFEGSTFGLSNEGDAFVERSSFIGNSSAISNSGSIQIGYSAIQGNSNSGFGYMPMAAGIGNSGALLLHHSSVTGNRGSGTGGILSSGSMSIKDSTIAGNIASEYFTPGGAVNSDGAGGITVTAGTARLGNLTLVDNRYEPSAEAAPPGRLSGGLYVAGGSVSVANAVLAQNQHDQSNGSGGLNCTGSVSSSGYTFLQHAAGCSFTGTTGDITGGDPKLGPLSNHDGLTSAMVPLPGSPLIDRGSPDKVGTEAANACGRRDQRGNRRPIDGDNDGTARCDIGAVERGSSGSTSPYPPS